MSTRRGRSDSPLNGAVGYLNRLFSGPGQRDHSKQQWEGTASCQHPEAGHRACPGRGMAPSHSPIPVPDGCRVEAPVLTRTDGNRQRPRVKSGGPRPGHLPGPSTEADGAVAGPTPAFHSGIWSYTLA